MKRYLLAVARAVAGLFAAASLLSCWTDAFDVCASLVFVSVPVCAAAVGVGAAIESRTEGSALSFCLEALAGALIVAAALMPLGLLRADAAGFFAVAVASVCACGICRAGSVIDDKAEARLINEELEERRRD